MFLYCYTWILFKDIVGHRQDVALKLNSIAMMFGGLLTLSASLIFKVPDASMKLLFIERSWYVLAFITLTAIGYGLYSYLLTKYSPTFLAFAGFLDPLFGTLLGVMFFGHPFNMVFFYSFIMLFIGLYIFYREELQLTRTINKVK